MQNQCVIKCEKLTIYYPHLPHFHCLDQQSILHSKYGRATGLKKQQTRVKQCDFCYLGLNRISFWEDGSRMVCVCMRHLVSTLSICMWDNQIVGFVTHIDFVTPRYILRLCKQYCSKLQLTRALEVPSVFSVSFFCGNKENIITLAIVSHLPCNCA